MTETTDVQDLAGDALNVAVATEVWGRRSYRINTVDGETRWQLIHELQAEVFRAMGAGAELEDAPAPYLVSSYGLPDYARQPREMLDVQSQMERLGFWLWLQSPWRDGDPWRAGFTERGVTGFNGRPDHEATGDSGPEAVARAAVKAVRSVAAGAVRELAGGGGT
jgi:hypothetical protein